MELGPCSPPSWYSCHRNWCSFRLANKLQSRGFIAKHIATNLSSIEVSGPASSRLVVGSCLRHESWSGSCATNRRFDHLIVETRKSGKKCQEWIQIRVKLSLNIFCYSCFAAIPSIFQSISSHFVYVAFKLFFEIDQHSNTFVWCINFCIIFTIYYYKRELSWGIFYSKFNFSRYISYILCCKNRRRLHHLFLEFYTTPACLNLHQELNSSKCDIFLSTHNKVYSKKVQITNRFSSLVKWCEIYREP